MASEKDKAASDLMKALEALGQEMEQAHAGAVKEEPPRVMVTATGSYPPGYFMGPCEALREPKEKHIGDRYEVRYISSSIFRQRDSGEWYAVYGSSPVGARRGRSAAPTIPKPPLSTWVAT